MLNKENLIIIRNIFYRCFFIGLIFLVIAAIVYLPCKCIIANIYQTGFGITSTAYYNMWASFVGLIKTILIFLFLTPALALHWTARECELKDKTNQ